MPTASTESRVQQLTPASLNGGETSGRVLVAEDDPRLAAIAGLEAPPVVVGGYAVPLGETS